MRDRDGLTPGDIPPSREIPPDVVQRYQSLQEEMRQAVVLTPAVTQGETREERYQRRQRLRSRREEFQRNARRPLRTFTNPITLAAMIGAIVVLCVVSLAGGAVLGGALSQRGTIASTATKFWTAMEGDDYGAAHDTLDPLISLQDFTTKAQNANAAMGAITGWKLVPGSQQGGTTNDQVGKATYAVTRAGAGKIKAQTYDITLNFIYTSSNGWIITQYGALFDVPSQ